MPYVLRAFALSQISAHKTINDVKKNTEVIYRYGKATLLTDIRNKNAGLFDFISNKKNNIRQ